MRYSGIESKMCDRGRVLLSYVPQNRKLKTLPLHADTHDAAVMAAGLVEGHVKCDCFEELIRIVKPGKKSTISIFLKIGIQIKHLLCSHHKYTAIFNLISKLNATFEAFSCFQFLLIFVLAHIGLQNEL